MGYNIGVRLIEDFLAKSRQTRCKNMLETAEVIREAFRQYINISPQITNWNAEQDSFRFNDAISEGYLTRFLSLILDNNPLTDFVELPSEYSALSYCQMICGIIRGALEMVQLEVTATVEKVKVIRVVRAYAKRTFVFSGLTQRSKFYRNSNRLCKKINGCNASWRRLALEYLHTENKFLIACAIYCPYNI